MLFPRIAKESEATHQDRIFSSAAKLVRSNEFAKLVSDPGARVIACP